MIGTPWDDSQAGTGASAVAEHLDAVDPHPTYQLRSEAGAANGYAQLDPSGLVVQEPAAASASAAANKLAKADPGGKLESGWGGSADSLATLDGSALVPTAQQGSGSADSTTFLRGDRSWATALQGTLGSTDHALLRADGTGGLTAQGSGATLDDSANLTLGYRSFDQPITPSPWAGTGTNHDLPLPAWAIANGRYLALVRVRVQQNSTTSSFMARTAQLELTCSGGVWSIDATSMYASVGPLATSLGWLISGSNLRMNLSGVGGGNAGNVALVFEQFIFYGAL